MAGAVLATDGAFVLGPRAVSTGGETLSGLSFGDCRASSPRRPVPETGVRRISASRFLSTLDGGCATVIGTSRRATVSDSASACRAVPATRAALALGVRNSRRTLLSAGFSATCAILAILSAAPIPLTVSLFDVSVLSTLIPCLPPSCSNRSLHHNSLAPEFGCKLILAYLNVSYIRLS
jgi:hypothetical protein